MAHFRGWVGDLHAHAWIPAVRADPAYRHGSRTLVFLAGGRSFLPGSRRRLGGRPAVSRKNPVMDSGYRPDPGGSRFHPLLRQIFSVQAGYRHLRCFPAGFGFPEKPKSSRGDFTAFRKVFLPATAATHRSADFHRGISILLHVQGNAGPARWRGSLSGFDENLPQRPGSQVYLHRSQGRRHPRTTPDSVPAAVSLGL